MAAIRFQRNLQRDDKDLLVSDSELVTGVKVQWGRQAIHQEPGKVRLSCEFVLPRSQAYEHANRLLYQSVWLSLPSNTFSGVVDSVAVTDARAARGMAAVRVSATASPNNAVGRWLMSSPIIEFDGNDSTLTIMGIINDKLAELGGSEVLINPSLVSAYTRINMSGRPHLAMRLYDLILALHGGSPLQFPFFMASMGYVRAVNLLARNPKVFRVPAAAAEGTPTFEATTSNVPLAVDVFAGRPVLGDGYRAYTPGVSPTVVYPYKEMTPAGISPTPPGGYLHNPVTGPSSYGYALPYLTPDSSSGRTHIARIQRIYAAQFTPPRRVAIESRDGFAGHDGTDGNGGGYFSAYERDDAILQLDGDPLAAAYDRPPLFHAIGGTLTYTPTSTRHDITAVWAWQGTPVTSTGWGTRLPDTMAWQTANPPRTTTAPPPTLTWRDV